MESINRRSAHSSDWQSCSSSACSIQLTPHGNVTTQSDITLKSLQSSVGKSIEISRNGRFDASAARLPDTSGVRSLGRIASSNPRLKPNFAALPRTCNTNKSRSDCNTACSLVDKYDLLKRPSSTSNLKSYNVDKLRRQRPSGSFFPLPLIHPPRTHLLNVAHNRPESKKGRWRKRRTKLTKKRSSCDSPDTMNTNSVPSVADLLTTLSSTEDATRKMAVFKLQSLINDPSFAEYFVSQGGLSKLRDLILEANGNTLAYALASFAGLLEVDQGWNGVDGRVVQKAVELIVCEPLVNILRGALSVLVSVVSRLHHDDMDASAQEHIGGFKSLKPAIALYPQFLEMLVSRLSSADHSLCANALQLINSLVRDAITNDNEQEWPKFVKRIQDLGVIKAVYILMQSSASQDLAGPLLDFQALSKILLRRWRAVPVDLVKPEHRRTIKALHLSSNPEKSYDFGRSPDNQPKHNPLKWRRLGFTSESPESDFEAMGFLGMMDLSDYVRKHQVEFHHVLLEQADTELDQRCPVARASLAVTAILFEHFEVEKTELDDTKHYLAMESRANLEQVFKPLLLHWSRLHVAGLHAFLRLWKATVAEGEDFPKIVELVRILVESVVGGAERTKGIELVEQDLASFECSKLRELQMELLELTYEDIWGQNLRGIREDLRTETLQFVKEQRIRCLLEGAWFPGEADEQNLVTGKAYAQGYRSPSTSRFIKLSPDRRFLHFGTFEQSAKAYEKPPNLGMLRDKIDLSVVSSVVSNVTASDELPGSQAADINGVSQERFTTTKISIHGYAPDSKTKRGKSRQGHSRTHSRNSTRAEQKEIVLLTFQPQNHIVASEWLDGLLMLLDQQPITAETNKLISLVSEYGLKVRLLNVRFSDEQGLVEGTEVPSIPSREGLDEDYYYEV